MHMKAEGQQLLYCHNLQTQEMVSYLRLISGDYNKASTGSIQTRPVSLFQKKTIYKVISHNLGANLSDECFLFSFEWGKKEQLN